MYKKGKIFSIIMCLLFINTYSYSQKLGKVDFKRIFDQADDFLEFGEYEKALPLFLKIDSTETENNNIDFKIGMCYISMLTDRTRAIPFLESASQNVTTQYKDNTYSEKKAPVLSHYYLGQAYHLNFEFEKALKSFETFKSFLLPSEIAALKEVELHISYSKNAIELVKAPVNIKVQNIGEIINSPYPDYAPVISADEKTLIFTSRRPGSKGGKTDPKDGLPYEDIYISKKVEGNWTQPESISKSINSDGHEASIGLSPDGQTLYIYKDDVEGGGNIYYSTLRGDNWGVPVFLDNVNTYDWEPHASPSADGTRLFFTSNSKSLENYGGTDLYMAKKLPTGDWSLPINLGPKINTEFDEDSPFIHPNGTTLFFSSKGHKGMGGYDVFFSVWDDEIKEWSSPINIGYPINSPDHDIYYVLTPDGKRAYYSSFQKGGVGEKDIYMLELLDAEEIPLVLFKGAIKDERGIIPSDVIVIVTDNESGDLIGTYTPNSKSGEYLLILPPGINYNIAYEASGYLFKSENLIVPEDAAYSQIEKPVELSKIEIGKKMVLRNIFFDTDKSTLRNTSLVELNKLYNMLKENPGLAVEISGHTDHVGSDSYNKRLSQDRANAVVNFLIEKGISKSQLSAKGYGEERPIAPNLNPDKTNNEENMQLNRRVELEVTGIEKL